jgi:hypothetical protein
MRDSRNTDYDNYDFWNSFAYYFEKNPTFWWYTQPMLLAFAYFFFDTIFYLEDGDDIYSETLSFLLCIWRYITEDHSLIYYLSMLITSKFPDSCH